VIVLLAPWLLPAAALAPVLLLTALRGRRER
jgi:hypothetical protein